MEGCAGDADLAVPSCLSRPLHAEQLLADAGTKNIGTFNRWAKRVIAGEIRNPLGSAIIGKDLDGITRLSCSSATR